MRPRLGGAKDFYYPLVPPSLAPPALRSRFAQKPQLANAKQTEKPPRRLRGSFETFGKYWMEFWVSYTYLPYK